MTASTERLIPGLVSISFRGWPADDVVRAVERTGLACIEWGGDVHAPHGDTRTAETLRRRCFDAGIGIAAYGSYYRFEDIDFNAHRTSGPDPEAVLDTTEALGTDLVRIWPGHLGSAEAPTDWRRAVVERARELAEAAASRGLRLGFEFHDHSLTDTPESTLQLLEGIGHPAVSTFWQPYLHRSEEERRASLEAVLPFVTNIHCNYFGAHGWPDVQPLEKGKEAWRAYLDILLRTGRSHRVMLEHVHEHSLEQFERDAAVLQALCREAEGPRPNEKKPDSPSAI